MSAEVESLFYVREKPWHGLGVRCEYAPTSAEALKLSGLDWVVKKESIKRKGQDTGSYFIVRYSETNEEINDTLLAVGLSEKYAIVQNTDAFNFVDSLVSEGEMTYETAGSLFNGKKIWLLGKLPKTEILDEDYEPYICFTNSHDGSGAVRCCLTPIRVVCNNTLNLALSKAKRSFSINHTGDIKAKMAKAQETLGLAQAYMNQLAEESEKLVEMKLSNNDMDDILCEVYPIVEDSTERQKNTIEKVKQQYWICYNQPDLKRFENTAYAMVNAMADMVDHIDPIRKTATYKENRWNNIIQGTTDLDKLYSVIR